MQAKSTHASPPQSWQDELGIPPRFPRLRVKQVEDLLTNLEEPKICLRKRHEIVEIVISLRSSPSSLQHKLIKRFETSESRISEAFDEILWRKLAGARSSTWKTLSRVATEAYRQTWLHFLTSPSHSHPISKEAMRGLINNLDQNTKADRKGRKPTPKAELAALRKRYATLLRFCTQIHEAVVAAVSGGGSANTLSEKEIREAVWGSVKKMANRVPGVVDCVFEGRAFRKMPYKRLPQLHLPSTWKPHQLALGLVAVEHNVEFQTAQKMISAMPNENKSPKVVASN